MYERGNVLDFVRQSLLAPFCFQFSPVCRSRRTLYAASNRRCCCIILKIALPLSRRPPHHDMAAVIRFTTARASSMSMQLPFGASKFTAAIVVNNRAASRLACLKGDWRHILASRCSVLGRREELRLAPLASLRQ